MKRLILIIVMLMCSRAITAQVIGGESERYSNIADYKHLNNYIGVWRYEDTLTKTIFKVELITFNDGEDIVIRGRYSLSINNEFITDEFNSLKSSIINMESIKGYYMETQDYVVLYFRDRGNKNRMAGSEEWGDKCSYLKAYQENGKWYMQWHIIPEEAKLYFVESEDDIPGDFWTVPEDCILEKVE